MISIQDDAFLGCSNLKNIEIQVKEKTYVSVGPRAFGYESNIEKITVNTTKENIKEYLYGLFYYEGKVFDQSGDRVTF